MRSARRCRKASPIRAPSDLAPWLLIPGDQREDGERLAALVRLTAAALPEPKAKPTTKPKTKPEAKTPRRKDPPPTGPRASPAPARSRAAAGRPDPSS